MNKIADDIRVVKVTLNVGAGKDQNKLEKGVVLIKGITGINPVKTVTKKKIPAWGLRPGLPIGCKLTLRGKQAQEMLKRALYAKDNKLSPDSFDNEGNFAFGIKEYVDIKDAAYDPEVGMMGLEIAVTLEKPGYRIKKRQIRPAPVGKHHQITKEQAMNFVKQHYHVAFEE